MADALASGARVLRAAWVQVPLRPQLFRFPGRRLLPDEAVVASRTSPSGGGQSLPCVSQESRLTPQEPSMTAGLTKPLAGVGEEGRHLYTCPLCEAMCGLEIEVDGGRVG